MWTTSITTFLIALTVALAVTPVIRALAVRWEVGDKPNGRRIHIRMIPHLGGISLALGVFLAMGAPTWFGGGAPGWMEFGARTLPAIILIVALGLVDDMKSLRAIQKLVVQVIAGVLLVLGGLQLTTGIGALDGVAILGAAVSVIFFVGMSSAVNLIDGHDGLAAGVTMISALAFAGLSALLGSGLLVALSLAVAGACLGFLVFNFPPGRIYMGDTGSMFLGTMLAVIACGLTMLRPSVEMFVAVCLVLSVPMLDAALAVARRVVLRAPVFRADSLHMHHVLQQAGFAPRQTLAVLYCLQALLAVLGVATGAGFALPIAAAGVVLAMTFFAFIRMMVDVRAGGRSVPDISPTTVPLKRELSADVPRHTSAGR